MGLRFRVLKQEPARWEFPKIGVPYFGVLKIRMLLLIYYIEVPYFRKLPDHEGKGGGFVLCFIFCPPHRSCGAS